MKILFITILVIFSINLFSQEAIKKKYFSIGILGSSGVAHFNNLSNLSKTFQANGLPELKNSSINSLSGLSIEINRVIIQLFEIEQRTNLLKKSGYTSRMASEGYVGRFGFDLVKNSKIIVAPYLGLGSQNAKWYIDKEDKSKIENLFQSELNESYLLEMQNRNFGEFGLLFNIKVFNVGQNIDFICGGDLSVNGGSTGLWWLDSEATDVGKTNLNGFSAMVTLGLKYGFKQSK